MSKHFEAKNFRALTLIKSWLTALSIPFEASTIGGSDLVAIGRNGTEVRIQIRAEDSPPVAAGTLALGAGLITGRSIQTALDLFQGLVEMLGYEYTSPVNRGALPTRKAHFSDDFESVAFRHTDLHRVPNPSSADMARFEPIVKKAMLEFHRHYRDICQDNMLDYDDLKNIARVWTVAYLGMYRVPAERDLDNDNEKKLLTHLRQRFQEFRNLLHKKGRNTFANLDEAHIAVHGTPFDYAATFGGLGRLRRYKGTPEMIEAAADVFLQAAPIASEEDEIDSEYVSRHRELNTKTTTSRKASAEKLLEKLLAGLPHDEMVERLTNAIESDRIDPTARREAASRLRSHAGSCGSCANLLLAAAEEDEESAGVDAAGSEE